MKKTFLLSALLTVNLFVIAQVGIGIKIPESSAMLEVKATNKGILIPRMTLAQRNAIKSPANSLMIYQTDNTPGYYYYASNSWTRIANGNSIGGASNTFTAPLTLSGTTVSIQQANASTNGFLSAADWNKFNNVAPGTSVGDMLYWNGTGWVKLAAGKNGQPLVFCNGLPTWGGCLAILTTSVVSEITATAATCGGEISDDGGTPIKDKGIVWSTSPNPTVALSTKRSFGAGSGSFSGTITGLDKLTTYFARSYATNTAGTVYGNEISFTTIDVDVTTGLVAYYPFNGNANDESGNGNHGSLNGGIFQTTDRFGNNNSAYLFNGIDGFISVPSLNQSPYKPVTYSAWVILSSFFPNSPGHKFKTILGRQTGFVLDAGAIGFWADANYENGTFDNNFLMWRGGGITGEIPHSKSTFSLDKWVHIAWSQDFNGNWKWYINGELTNQGNFTDEFGYFDFFRIGGSNNDSNGNTFWDNKIDDVRIYNKVLTDSEISYLATH